MRPPRNGRTLGPKVPARRGAVSAVGNRRAFRVGEEPLGLFQRYCAAYPRKQAYCYFSLAPIANLERYWNAQNRKG